MDLFGQVGEIVSAKCVTGKGYGFVRFETVEMATQAIQEVNDLPFNGTTIRVKYADNKKGSGKGWDQSGGYDQSGSSPSDAGQGTPPWKKNRSAANRPEVADGAEGEVQEAHVVPPPASLQNTGARIFIEDLPPEISPEDILFIFDNYCAADDCQVLWSDSSQSIAMIYVPAASEAEWILENLNGNIPEGLDEPVRISMAQQPEGAPRRIAPLYGKDGQVDEAESASHHQAQGATSESGEEHSNVYVCQLPDGSDDDYLRELFQECGTIVSVKCVADKRFGFVRFSTTEEAQEAIDTMNGVVIEGTETPIVCRFAKR